ncbi:MAG: hypothetical protein KAJ49_00850 [Arcobacteraceae bacterium]|nr:hypothetical protein [Arcobacteraceae bacterium]
MKYKELIQFNSLFEDSPALALLHINNDFDSINKAMEFTAQRNNGKLETKDISGIDCEKFRVRTRDYEYAVLTNTLKDCTHKNKFLSTIYHSLENSAFIILIEDKKHSTIEQMIELLDEENFLAINDIDIFEDYNLVMAKKMHMWGAGL